MEHKGTVVLEPDVILKQGRDNEMYKYNIKKVVAWVVFACYALI